MTRKQQNIGCLGATFKLIGLLIKATVEIIKAFFKLISLIIIWLNKQKITLPIQEGYQISGLLIVSIFCLLTICGSLFSIWADTQLRAIGVLPTYTPLPTSTATATNSPTPTQTSTSIPTVTPTSTPTKTPAPTDTPSLSPTPKATIPPDPTNVPTPQPTTMPVPTLTSPAVPPTPVQPAFSGDIVDPAWWPCQQGQIKGNIDSMIYHVPGGLYYAKTYEGVECFDTTTEAENKGYRRSKR